MPREALLARTFVQLADTLVEDFDIVELLTLLTDSCVDVLDVAAAGVMLVSPSGGLRVMASSSEAMRLLELFELQAEEGPCLDCFRAGMAVVNEDLDSVDGRWPRFAPEALAAGFRSVHALPMRLRGSVLGALNLFQQGAGRLRPADVQAGQALADIATIAILQHRAVLEVRLVNDQLQRAFTTRVVIEQAKGYVAERFGVEIGDSFTLLRTYARNHNVRIAAVAQQVVDGTLDPAQLGSTPRADSP